VYNGTAYAYVKSLQGDIVAILDENGNTVVSYGYDAWGAPLWCTGELAETLGKVQPFRYRGYVFDEEIGLYYLRIPLIIAPKPAVSSSTTQSFEKKRNSSALFAREINLVTQPSFDCEQGINSQVQTACSNADAVFPVLGIVFCKNERFSLSRKTHVQLWNEPRISHVRLL